MLPAKQTEMKMTRQINFNQDKLIVWMLVATGKTAHKKSAR